MKAARRNLPASPKKLSHREGAGSPTATARSPGRWSSWVTTAAATAATVGRPTAPAGLLESVVLALLLPLVGWGLHASDPYFLSGSFPWFLLPSLLAALRHGFVAGCASATTVAVPVIVLWRMRGLESAHFPAEALLGMVVTTMIAGQTSDVWFRERKKLVGTLELAGNRANEFARAHFLTQLSHERLQEGNPALPNLQNAVARLLPPVGQPKPTWRSVGSLLMSVLSQYCGVEAATLLSVNEGGVCSPEAKLGNPVPVPLDDELLQIASRRGQIACIDRHATAESEPALSLLLAVIPAVDSGGIVRGHLCVQSIPFFYFHHNNLENIAVLMAHCADRVGLGGSIFDAHTEHQRLFEERLAESLLERKEGISSVVGVLELPPGSALRPLADRLLPAILGPRDLMCRRRLRRGAAALWMLLPGGDEGRVHTVVLRLNELARRELGRNFEETGAGAAFRVVAVEDTPGKVFAALEEALDSRRGDA